MTAKHWFLFPFLAVVACGDPAGPTGDPTGPVDSLLLVISDAYARASRTQAPISENPAVRSLAAVNDALTLSGSTPTEALGRTYTYYPRFESYGPDPARTGAPADAIRFILYAVDPAAHQLRTPLEEAGHVDLIAGEADSAFTVRAVVNGATAFEYAASGRIDGAIRSIGNRVVRMSALLWDGSEETLFEYADTVIMGSVNAMGLAMEESERRHYAMSVAEQADIQATYSIGVSHQYGDHTGSTTLRVAFASWTPPS